MVISSFLNVASVVLKCTRHINGLFDEKTNFILLGAKPAVFGSALSHGSEQVLRWQNWEAVGLTDLAQTWAQSLWKSSSLAQFKRKRPSAWHAGTAHSSCVNERWSPGANEFLPALEVVEHQFPRNLVEKKNSGGVMFLLSSLISFFFNFFLK